jgi:hypothetical protein
LQQSDFVSHLSMAWPPSEFGAGRFGSGGGGGFGGLSPPEDALRGVGVSDDGLDSLGGLGSWGDHSHQGYSGASGHGGNGGGRGGGGRWGQGSSGGYNGGYDGYGGDGSSGFYGDLSSHGGPGGRGSGRGRGGGGYGGGSAPPLLTGLLGSGLEFGGGGGESRSCSGPGLPTAGGGGGGDAAAQQAAALAAAVAATGGTVTGSGEYVHHFPGPPIQTSKAMQQGPDGCNLFIFHIPNDLTNMDLYSLFVPFGPVRFGPARQGLKITRVSSLSSIFVVRALPIRLLLGVLFRRVRGFLCSRFRVVCV